MGKNEWWSDEWAKPTDVTVTPSVTTVTSTSVDTLVCDTTAVTTSVWVAVRVEAAAVVTPMVTVVGCGFRQLQALDSLEAGWWSRFLVFRSMQLGAALTDDEGEPLGVICRLRGDTAAGASDTVTVAVTVCCTTSVEMAVAVDSTVVTLWFAGQ